MHENAFWKHGRILSKFGMQVSIGYFIIEDENSFFLHVSGPLEPTKSLGNF